MADSARVVIVAQNASNDDFNAVSTAINESVTATDVSSIMSAFDPIINGNVRSAKVTAVTTFYASGSDPE